LMTAYERRQKGLCTDVAKSTLNPRSPYITTLRRSADASYTTILRCAHYVCCQCCSGRIGPEGPGLGWVEAGLGSSICWARPDESGPDRAGLEGNFFFQLWYGESMSSTM
jgi:hypothetical protein